MRVKWLGTSATDQIVPRGVRTAVYAFKVVSGSNTAQSFRSGGAAGDILEVLGAPTNSTFVDDLGGSGNYIEFPDGVHVTLGGVASAWILVRLDRD